MMSRKRAEISRSRSLSTEDGGEEHNNSPSQASTKRTKSEKNPRTECVKDLNIIAKQNCQSCVAYAYKSKSPSQDTKKKCLLYIWIFKSEEECKTFINGGVHLKNGIINCEYEKLVDAFETGNFSGFSDNIFGKPLQVSQYFGHESARRELHDTSLRTWNRLIKEEKKWQWNLYKPYAKVHKCKREQFLKYSNVDRNKIVRLAKNFNSYSLVGIVLSVICVFDMGYSNTSSSSIQSNEKQRKELELNNTLIDDNVLINSQSDNNNYNNSSFFIKKIIDEILMPGSWYVRLWIYISILCIIFIVRQFYIIPRMNQLVKTRIKEDPEHVETGKAPGYIESFEREGENERNDNKLRRRLQEKTNQRDKENVERFKKKFPDAGWETEKAIDFRNKGLDADDIKAIGSMMKLLKEKTFS